MTPPAELFEDPPPKNDRLIVLLVICSLKRRLSGRLSREEVRHRSEDDLCRISCRRQAPWIRKSSRPIPARADRAGGLDGVWEDDGRPAACGPLGFELCRFRHGDRTRRPPDDCRAFRPLWGSGVSGWRTSRDPATVRWDTQGDCNRWRGVHERSNPRADLTTWPCRMAGRRCRDTRRAYRPSPRQAPAAP